MTSKRRDGDSKSLGTLRNWVDPGTPDEWVSIFSALTRAARDNRALCKTESDRLAYLGWAVVENRDLALTSDGRAVLRLLRRIARETGVEPLRPSVDRERLFVPHRAANGA